MTEPWRPKPKPRTPENLAKADEEERLAWAEVHRVGAQIIAMGAERGLDCNWPNPIPQRADAPADMRRLVTRYWQLVDLAVAKSDVVRAYWADILP